MAYDDEEGTLFLLSVGTLQPLGNARLQPAYETKNESTISSEVCYEVLLYKTVPVP